MLFDDGLPDELARALRSLESAQVDMNVPYPFEPQQDQALLRRVKGKYPAIDLSDLVDKFLVWCVDVRPWETEKGKPVTIRWRSRLWTWAVNDERYRAAAVERGGGQGRRRSGTHQVATPTGHGDASEVLERW